MTKYFNKTAIILFVFFSFVLKPVFSEDDPNKKSIATQKIVFEGASIDDAYQSMRNYIKENFPLITNKTIDVILEKKSIEPYYTDENSPENKKLFYKVTFDVPVNYLIDTVKLLWVLNIPEFRSYLYQLYSKDTIYIDTWNNVVGTNKDKTYTGNFEAYKIRNWPSWKDPEKGKENVPATPPGPKNPLGLFVVHFDENSLRYFHGTNKEYLLDDKFRSLSHGCVRNLNENIQKMKEFIIKKVVKTKDLTFWLDSKKSMEYNFDESERFPVKILYKTYKVDKDETGEYVELYRDIYGYRSRNFASDKFNEADLVFTTSRENLLKEYRESLKGKISDEEILPVFDYIIKHGQEYEKYYIKDIKK